MSVCKAYMQQINILMPEIKDAKSHKNSLQGISDALVLANFYQVRIEKPYGTWMHACLSDAHRKGTPACSALVDAVKKPACAKATKETYFKLQRK